MQNINKKERALCPEYSFFRGIPTSVHLKLYFFYVILGWVYFFLIAIFKQSEISKFLKDLPVGPNHILCSLLAQEISPIQQQMKMGLLLHRFQYSQLCFHSNVFESPYNQEAQISSGCILGCSQVAKLSLHVETCFFRKIRGLLILQRIIYFKKVKRLHNLIKKQQNQKTFSRY